MRFPWQKIETREGPSVVKVNIPLARDVKKNYKSSEESKLSKYEEKILTAALCIENFARQAREGCDNPQRSFSLYAGDIEELIYLKLRFEEAGYYACQPEYGSLTLDVSW